MLDPVIPDLLGALYDALLEIPGVRFVMGLASPTWRPLWAITWLVAIVYVVVRTLESLQRRALYRLLAGLPSAAPPPAPSARPAGLRPAEAPPVMGGAATAPPGEDAPTAIAAGAYTPDPAPGPTMAELVQRTWPKPPSRAARAALGAAALGALLALVSLFRSGDAEENGAAAGALAVDTSFAPDTSADAPPFTFAARGWRQAGGACVATLEVTGAAQPAGPLTMFVMDAAGTVLGTAALRVPVLTTGTFQEFRFPGVNCDAVTQWQVQG